MEPKPECNAAELEWKTLARTEGGRIAEVVARLGRWQAKALIISTRVCPIACTYTRVNPACAHGAYVRTPCVLGTHKSRLWVFCKLEQVIPLADERSGCALRRCPRACGALPRARLRPRAFVYLPAVLQLTSDFCGKNEARLIPGIVYRGWPRVAALHPLTSQ